MACWPLAALREIACICPLPAVTGKSMTLLPGTIAQTLAGWLSACWRTTLYNFDWLDRTSRRADRLIIDTPFGPLPRFTQNSAAVSQS